MQSELYNAQSERLYSEYTRHFDGIVGHGSFYLLREVPDWVARDLLLPHITKLLDTQNRDGGWREKDSRRVSHDILRALKHSGILDELQASQSFRYDLKGWVRESEDIYSALVCCNIFGCENIKFENIIDDIVARQDADGSWDGSLVSTCRNAFLLYDLGMEKSAESLKRAAGYILSRYEHSAEAWHLTAPYGLTVNGAFCGDRLREFEAACEYRAEWEPRSVCFRHLGIIQNNECLRLLIKLGYEDDSRFIQALNTLYALIDNYGGLCYSDIKKEYLKK
ncbi:MAG: hypothetical protein AB9835_05880 [Eubacteriales bacterium]